VPREGSRSRALRTNIGSYPGVPEIADWFRLYALSLPIRRVSAMDRRFPVERSNDSRHSWLCFRSPIRDRKFPLTPLELSLAADASRAVLERLSPER
jgi:hypothetical protein